MIINSSYKQKINNTEPRNNHLLYNSSIRINNESIKFNILSENNITFVYDVLNTDGQFLSLNEFEDKFNINICFVTYMGIINAIKKHFNPLEMSTRMIIIYTYYL